MMGISISVLPGGELPPVRDVLATINQTLIDMSDTGEEMLLEPTEHWQDKPVFAKRTTRPGVREVRTDHQKYNWTDKGTRKHWIFPRKPGGRLVFMGAFSAKTSPGSLAGGPGASGPPKVFAGFGVLHPGTEPRRFSQLVQAEINKLLARTLTTRLRLLMRRRR